jgi:two-component system chemotaxis response regulator CheB
MFNAIAELKPKKVLAILLTGMGTDGAKGLLNLKKIGSTTVAQDEKTSIVYGMPKAAAQLGAADWILPLDHVSGFIKTWMDKN